MKLEEQKILRNAQSAAGDSPERVVLKYPLGGGRYASAEAHRQPSETSGAMELRARQRLEKKVEAAS